MCSSFSIQAEARRVPPVPKLLKDVLEECIKEPAFSKYTLHAYPDRPEVLPYEVWAGTRERFKQEEMKRPYRKPFMKEQKLYLEHVDVD
jgi:hypothetical protein